jgi:hypothetical protein
MKDYDMKLPSIRYSHVNTILAQIKDFLKRRAILDPKPEMEPCVRSSSIQICRRRSEYVFLGEKVTFRDHPPGLFDDSLRSKMYREPGNSTTDPIGGIEFCPVQFDLLVDPLSLTKHRFVTIITADRLPTDIVTAQIGPAQVYRTIELKVLSINIMQSRLVARKSESILTRASIGVIERALLSPVDMSDQEHFLQKSLPTRSENST